MRCLTLCSVMIFSKKFWLKRCRCLLNRGRCMLFKYILVGAQHQLYHYHFWGGGHRGFARLYQKIMKNRIGLLNLKRVKVEYGKNRPLSSPPRYLLSAVTAVTAVQLCWGGIQSFKIWMNNASFYLWNVIVEGGYSSHTIGYSKTALGSYLWNPH